MLIYKITNRINDKIYIGQTVRTLHDRIHDYIKDTKYIKTEQARPIIRAMQKYGINNFKFEIIEDDIKDRNLLDIEEMNYISKFNSQNPLKGYNIENGGNSEGKHTKSTREKISKAQRGCLNHMYGKCRGLNPTAKPIIDLTTGITYDSIIGYIRDNKMNESEITKICQCCKGQRMSSGGHVLRYIINGEPENIKQKTTTKTFTSIVDETSGEIFIDCHDCAKYFNRSLNDIRLACRGKYKINGHILRYGNKVKYEVMSYNKANSKVLPQYRHLVNTVPNLIIRKIKEV